LATIGVIGARLVILGEEGRSSFSVLPERVPINWPAKTGTIHLNQLHALSELNQHLLRQECSHVACVLVLNSTVRSYGLRYRLWCGSEVASLARPAVVT
jgi:hypothetical protein